MQQTNKHRIAVLFMLVITSMVFFSFSSPDGGDSFEIYVNNKLVVQRYLTQAKPTQTLNWNQGNYNDQVDIYYSHCGVSGKNRTIAVKDAQNKTLKSWEFADAASGHNNAMSCKVKDILSAGRNSNTLYLYYSSRELPNGYLLATIKGS